MTIARKEDSRQQLKNTVIGLAVGGLALGILLSRPHNLARLFPAGSLAPGTVAPEIIGVDVGGKQMKLSDYRGKVVMLDFFGNW
jgi:hypothetical protein